MVFDPKRPQGPSTVPGSYIITSADGVDFDSMVNDIDALVKREGRENSFQWTNKMPFIGVAAVMADEYMAAKLAALPSVGAVEPERRVYIQKKKPGGPGF